MTNSIRNTLTTGKPSIGSWLNLGSPLAAEVMVTAGFDWLAVDAEHTSYDMGLIAHMIRAIEARGAIPLVRSWDHDPMTIARLLDAGAWGLVFPHISTPEQAANVARAMRYPPQGCRSVGMGRCLTITPDYRRIANDLVLCIPQIEDMQGVENAEAIARVEGVDIGFLGPADLAMSMGVEPGHSDHEAALQSFREDFLHGCKPSGIPVLDGMAARRRIQEGFQFIDLTNDMHLLKAAAAQALSVAEGQ